MAPSDFSPGACLHNMQKGQLGFMEIVLATAHMVSHRMNAAARVLTLNERPQGGLGAEHVAVMLKSLPRSGACWVLQAFVRATSKLSAPLS